METGNTKQKLLKYIPTRNKVGAIIRTTDNIGRLNLLEQAIKQLLTIDTISLIHVVIHNPKEKGIWDELIKLFGKERKRVQLERVTRGNLHGDILLNFAKNEQTRRGIDYSISISPEAYLYATKENINKILSAAEEGSLATALLLSEYEEIIKLGHISSAFCMYRNAVVDFVDIWEIQAQISSQDKGEHDFGMEEVLVAKRLLDDYGKGSITVVTPTSGSIIESNDPENIKKREMVRKTKTDRFKKMCQLLQIEPEFFQKNIIWK